jgi:hypothetical protein
MFDRAHWIRRHDQRSINVGRRVREGVWKGMLAGAGGIAVMTLGENSSKPSPSARAPSCPHTRSNACSAFVRSPTTTGQAEHRHVRGQAILLGAWRGVMAEGGLRGPRASALFTVI